MSANVESRGLIHKGDMTTTGGVVTQGVGNIMFVGSGVSQTGMIATCPSCKKGQGNITPIKAINVIVDGVQAALHGDIVTCGCPYGSNTVIASVGAMSVSVKNGVVTGVKPFSSPEEASAAYSDVAAMAGARYEPAPQEKSKNELSEYSPLGSKKEVSRYVIRLEIEGVKVGYTVQSLKGLKMPFHQPAVIVPVYDVNVIKLGFNENDVEVSRDIKFKFNVTRDAWYYLGKDNTGNNKFLNREFVPDDYERNLYKAQWIPSYPNPISATYLPSGLDAFIFTRFGNRSIPAKPLDTLYKIDGSPIDSLRKDNNVATDVMIHVGGYYEILNWDYLGGSYGCFGFIPTNDIFNSIKEAEQASINDDYDNEKSNKTWKAIVDKIIQLSFSDNIHIEILLKERLKNEYIIPDKILKE